MEYKRRCKNKKVDQKGFNSLHSVNDEFKIRYLLCHAENDEEEEEEEEGECFLKCVPCS